MALYAKDWALDKKGNKTGEVPNYVSTQAQGGVPLASSVISLNANTTVIDVACIGGASANSAIIGKWGTSSVTSSNFDWIVVSGDTRTFVVPINPTNGSPTGSIAGANVANGLFNAVAVKTATAQSASVFTAEY